ncbi:MAG: two-component regulator propeller domain-containing protein [Desulfobacteraceae bacterium]
MTVKIFEYMKRFFYLKCVLACLPVFIFTLPSHAVKFDHPLNTGAYNNSIMQDKDGFLWIGCSRGIIRYNGYEMEVFKAGPDSLSSAYAPGIFEDSEGLLWIGTIGGGLNVYDKKANEFTWYKNDPDDPSTLNSNQFNWAPDTIDQDKEGLIWIGTQAGVNVFDKKTQGFVESFKHDPDDPETLGHNSVWTIMVDSRNLVWIGTRKGLDCYDKKTGTFTHYKHDPSDPSSIGKGTVYSVLESSSGDLWVGTSKGGLNRLDRKTGKFTRYMNNPDDPGSISHNEVYTICEDREGSLWIGRTYSVEAGLEKFSPEDESFETFRHDPENSMSISGDIIMSCFEDRSGILWIVENTGPIDKFDKYRQKFKLYQQNPSDKNYLSSNVVNTITEDSRGNMWFATQLGGLNKFNRETGDFTVYRDDPEGISNNYVFSVLEDSRGDLWVSMNNGEIGILNRKTGRFIKKYKNPHDDVLARGMIEDKLNPDVLWFGTETDGIFSFNKTTGKFRQYQNDPDDSESLSINHVFNLFQTDDGTLWVPTQGGGLDRFVRESESFKHYRSDPEDPTTISGNSVIDCYIDSVGNFWVSCDDGGLNRFDPGTGTFTRYTEEHGFPTKSVRSILEDDRKNLWLSSDKGLIQFSIEKEKVLKVYDEKDGLQGSHFTIYPTSSHKTDEGQLWFSGLNGVNSFYPGEITRNEYIPPIRLTALKHGKKQLKSHKLPDQIEKIELPWQDNSFEFEFAALNYTQPMKNRYAYVLDGFEKEWNHIGTRRYGKYTNLPGGTYTLKLFGANNDGVWNRKGTSIKVKVGVPPWKTWWAYLLYFAVLAGSVSGFVKYRSGIYEARLEKNRKELEKEKEISDTLRSLHKKKANLISKQREVEQVLRQKRDDLEKIVEIRTSELIRKNEDLLEEKEKADAANRAKSEFLAHMSHEIRTPLNLILGFTDMLEKTVTNHQSKEYIATIRSSGKSLMVLLNDILDLSKVESGKLKIQNSAFSIYSLFHEMEHIFSKKAEQKGIDFVLELHPHIPDMIVMDDVRLRQILLNLAGNAVKFTEDGYVKLSAWIVEHPDEKTLFTFAFSVADTGIGIASDQLNTVFGAFSQQKGQDFTKYGGAGLGLAITKRLVEKMGGDIKVESTLGQGSVFKVTFYNVEKSCAPDYKDKVDYSLAHPGPKELLAGIEDLDTKEDMSISPEKIEKLSECIRKLRELKKSKWDQLVEAMVISDIKSFGTEICSLAAEYEIRPLYSWAEILFLEAENFEMDRLPDTLKSFPEIINKLEALVEKRSL